MPSSAPRTLDATNLAHGRDEAMAVSPFAVAPAGCHSVAIRVRGGPKRPHTSIVHPPATPVNGAAPDWNDIDRDANRVRVERGLYRGRTDLPKSNKPRTIALTPPALEALGSLLEIQGYYPHGLVFRNKSGRQLTEPTLTRVLERGTRPVPDRPGLLLMQQALRLAGT